VSAGDSASGSRQPPAKPYHQLTITPGRAGTAYGCLTGHSCTSRSLNTSFVGSTNLADRPQRCLTPLRRVMRGCETGDRVTLLSPQSLLNSRNFGASCTAYVLINTSPGTPHSSLADSDTVEDQQDRQLAAQGGSQIDNVEQMQLFQLCCGQTTPPPACATGEMPRRRHF